jgi:hypothetical protein
MKILCHAPEKLLTPQKLKYICIIPRSGHHHGTPLKKVNDTARAVTNLIILTF